LRIFAVFLTQSLRIPWFWSTVFCPKLAGTRWISSPYLAAKILANPAQTLNGEAILMAFGKQYNIFPKITQD
jgi:hypothetical protein